MSEQYEIVSKYIREPNQETFTKINKKYRDYFYERAMMVRKKFGKEPQSVSEAKIRKLTDHVYLDYTYFNLDKQKQKELEKIFEGLVKLTTLSEAFHMALYVKEEGKDFFYDVTYNPTHERYFVKYSRGTSNFDGTDIEMRMTFASKYHHGEIERLTGISFISADETVNEYWNPSDSRNPYPYPLYNGLPENWVEPDSESTTDSNE